MDKNEAILREQIAKEIESLCTDECQLWDRIQFHNGHNAAAAIARGNNNGTTTTERQQDQKM